MFKFLILCFIFEVSTAAVCPGSAFTDAIQTSVVTMHNNFRSQLAKGLSTIKGGATASGAKNMYQFTYDCALAQTAQTQANKCVWAHSASTERNGAGENLFANFPLNSDIQNSITLGLNNWWGELATYGGITPTNVKLTSANVVGLGHWSQMAWGKTTTVGCAVKLCPAMSVNGETKSGNFLVCHYKIAGNLGDADIYERGTACAADADCTTYANSHCNLSTKLCYTGDTVTTATTAAAGATTTPTTTTKATTTVTTPLGWTEWAASTCTANCGLCGRVVMRRVCRSGSCPGANTMTSTTRCGASSFCAFGLGLPSCCEPAKRAIVNGVLTCA